MKGTMKAAILAVGLFVAVPTTPGGVQKNIKQLIKTSKQSFKTMEGLLAELNKLTNALKGDNLTAEDRIALCAQIADILEDALKVQIASVLESAASVIKAVDKKTAKKLGSLVDGIRDMGGTLEDVSRVLRSVQATFQEITKIGKKTTEATPAVEVVEEEAELDLPAAEGAEL